MSALDIVSIRTFDEYFSFEGSIEPLYLLLAQIATWSENDLAMLLFLSHLIIITCFYIGFYRLKKYSPVWLSVFLFCFLIYNMSLQLSRQMISIAIVFLGATFLLEKKILIFSVSLLLAICFHRSAILGALLIPFLYTNNRKIVIGIFISIAIFFSAFNYLLPLIKTIGLEKFVKYGEVGAEREGRLSISELLLHLIFLGSFLILSRKKLDHIRNVSWLFICEFILNLFQLRSAFLGRIGYYLYVFYIPFLPHVVFLNYENKIKNKPVRVAGIMLFIIAYWAYVYIYSRAAATYPYTSAILGIR
jgi:hypothetical protein